jgi:hypothetical protein
MRSSLILLAAVAALTSSSAFAGEAAVPTGLPELKHVFVIMMENHAYGQIAGNPQAPFINSEMANANLAANYYAIAHPSSTNYLEVVGGSNFNNLSDQYPNWHNTSCTPNIVSGITNTDDPSTGTVCPIAGIGTDAAIPVVDTSTNETKNPPLTNIDGVQSIPAESNIFGISIADQLVAAGKTWKSYQEGLPLIGADGVNVSDGYYSIGGNNAQGQPVSTDFSTLTTSGNPVSAANIVYLYAVKHDPFAYFASVQQGANPALSLSQIVSFDSDNGLYADLRAGGNRVPNLAFIAPNQCDDQHGRGNGTAFCNYDADDNGTQTGLNPSLIMQGDLAVQRIVTAIKASSAWSEEKSAIVIMWDENDYSTTTKNQVVLVVDTNYGPQKLESRQFYDHYSLTKTLDGVFRLPCLNHACDPGVSAMADLFATR